MRKKEDTGKYNYIRGLGKRADLAACAGFILLSVLVILPIVLITAVSLTSEDAIVNSGYSFFPGEWSLDAYRYLAGNIGNILQAFIITVLITVTGTMLSLFLIATMSFALSQRDFRYRKLFTVIVMIPMFFGGGLAASYAVNTQIFALKNTFLALVLPTACSGWYIIVMRTFFMHSIPEEILEAARIDGASTYRIFWKFVIPLSKPILMTVGVFEAFSYWNSWYENLIYTDSNHRRLFTLQYVLYNMEKNVSFVTTNDNISGLTASRIPSESLRMALAVVIILPIILTFPFFRKYFEKGLTAGALK
jgi:putative aldouronate transport system permease protein